MLTSLLSGSAAAQGMYKCKDAAGKITYAGKECHLLGLTDAGAVTGRAVVTPAVKSQPNRPAPSPAPAAAAPSPAKQSAATGKEPAAPERRCFTVRTAKGTATRCNDNPDDDVIVTK